MATITAEDCKEAVGRLYKAGKQMPQRDRIYAAAQDKRAAVAMAIMQDTIDAFSAAFVPRKIGVERWQKAIEIAVVSAERELAPSLMEGALKQAEQAYVQENMARNIAEKRNEFNAPLDDSVNAQLWRWTAVKRAAGHLFMPYMPTQQTAFAYGRQIGLSDAAIERQMPILKAFISDVNHHKATGKKMMCSLKINKEKQQLFLEVL